jgi:hypothetical protein
MKPYAMRKKSFWAVSCLVLLSGCGQDLDVGSDVLWTARFEVGGNSFPEWTSVPGGNYGAFPPPNNVEVSSEYVHHGRFAAKLTINAPVDNPQGYGSSLVRQGNLPVQAYYSAWYYLPSKVTVGIYWVIMKFRYRTVADDPTTENELFDLNLKNLPGGDMSLRLYDHRSGDLPLDVADPIVPVGNNVWFQVEALYRADALDGQFALWLDGNRILNYEGPTGAPPWVAWDVVSVGEDLTLPTALLYVDDCAISNTRVGRTGVIAK